MHHVQQIKFQHNRCCHSWDAEIGFAIARAPVQTHTPSMACDKLAANGPPNAQQIWAESAEPFLRNGYEVCTCARAEASHRWLLDTPCLMGSWKHTKSQHNRPSRYRAIVKELFSTPRLRRVPRAAVVTHMTRYNSHRQERRWSYPSEKTACQSDSWFRSYRLLHNVTCERFDGGYGQCKPGINVTAHVSLETERYLAENFIFDDHQYEQHARSRREISFSSVEFESLSFGSGGILGQIDQKFLKLTPS